MALQEIPTMKPITNAKAIEAAIGLYEQAAQISARLGLQTAAGIFDVPRKIFDGVLDYVDDTCTGILVVDDRRGAMWMKRCAHNVSVYTRQLPRED